MNDTVTITANFLRDGMTGAGGYKRAQLKILGVDWPPKGGWKKRVIGNTITKADAERFLQLKTETPLFASSEL